MSKRSNKRNKISQSRLNRKINASQLRGTITTTTISLSPDIPQSLNVPKGYVFTDASGYKCKTLEQLFFEKKKIWKILKFFNKKYRPSKKVKVQFI